MKPTILVSACLLGYRTKYSGEDNYTPDIEKLKEKFNLVAFCPEVDGGLDVPRPPSEIQGEKVTMLNGVDVTHQYNLGAKIAVRLAQKYDAQSAIMKERSPACGSELVYDGTFSKKLIAGMGIAAKALKQIGVKVYNEKNFMRLLDE